MNRVDDGLQRVAEVVANHASCLTDSRQACSVAQHPSSFLNQIFQVFRTCPKLLLNLFSTVDIDERQYCSLDLVVRGPVWSHPDEIPAPVRTLRLNFLVDVTVDYFVYYFF